MRSTFAGRAAVVFAVAGLMTPAVGRADGEPRIARLRLSSGLRTQLPGNTVAVNVVEVGSLAASTPVQIQVFDAADRVLASTEGVLERGQPVHMELPLPASGGRLQVRVSVILTRDLTHRSAPIVTLEDVGPDGLTIGGRVSCAPPIGGGIGTSAYCPEWQAVNLSGQ